MRFLYSVFKCKLDLSTAVSLNSGSPSGTILNGRGGAHAYLHVSEIWNGHDSHFRDVTPLESIEGDCKHIKHCIQKDVFIIRGKKHNILCWIEQFLEGKIHHVTTLSSTFEILIRQKLSQASGSPAFVLIKIWSHYT